jgi:hypothetical protein
MRIMSPTQLQLAEASRTISSIACYPTLASADLKATVSAACRSFLDPRTEILLTILTPLRTVQ